MHPSWNSSMRNRIFTTDKHILLDLGIVVWVFQWCLTWIIQLYTLRRFQSTNYSSFLCLWLHEIAQSLLKFKFSYVLSFGDLVHSIFL